MDDCVMGFFYFFYSGQDVWFDAAVTEGMDGCCSRQLYLCTRSILKRYCSNTLYCAIPPFSIASSLPSLPRQSGSPTADAEQPGPTFRRAEMLRPACFRLGRGPPCQIRRAVSFTFCSWVVDNSSQILLYLRMYTDM